MYVFFSWKHVTYILTLHCCLSQTLSLWLNVLYAQNALEQRIVEETEGLASVLSSFSHTVLICCVEAQVSFFPISIIKINQNVLNNSNKL